MYKISKLSLFYQNNNIINNNDQIYVVPLISNYFISKIIEVAIIKRKRKENKLTIKILNKKKIGKW